MSTRLSLFQRTLIIIDLSKQQVLDADPKATQKINFTRNLDRAGNTAMFLITDEAKETKLDFSDGTVNVLKIYVAYNINIKWLKITL